MPASSLVYFTQQCSSVVDGDAPLEDTGNAALVEFTVYYGEGFRSPDDSFCFYWIRRQFLLC
jgi:hypothetical protein